MRLKELIRALPAKRQKPHHVSRATTHPKDLVGEIAPAEGSSLEDAKKRPKPLYNQDLMNEALVQIGQRAKIYFTLPLVKPEDISISSSPTTYEAIGAYITAMGQAVGESQELAQINKSDVTIIKDAVESKNTQEINILRASTQKNIANAKKRNSSARIRESSRTADRNFYA